MIAVLAAAWLSPQPIIEVAVALVALIGYFARGRVYRTGIADETIDQMEKNKAAMESAALLREAEMDRRDEQYKADVATRDARIESLEKQVTSMAHEVETLKELLSGRIALEVLSEQMGEVLTKVESIHQLVGGATR